jgi:hypothetical protein
VFAEITGYNWKSDDSFLTVAQIFKIYRKEPILAQNLFLFSVTQLEI